MALIESRVRGRTNVPLIDKTIEAVLHEATERLAEREAMVMRHKGICWT